MKYYGIDSRGQVFIQRVSTTPAWNNAYEGRIIYANDDEELYLGIDDEWRGLGDVPKGETILFESDTTVAGYSLAIYTGEDPDGGIVYITKGSVAGGETAGTAKSSGTWTQPNHNHTMNNHTHSGPSHSHDLNSHTHSMQNHIHSMSNHTHNMGTHTHNMGNHFHSGPSHTHLVPILGYGYDAVYSYGYIGPSNPGNFPKASISPPTGYGGSGNTSPPSNNVSDLNISANTGGTLITNTGITLTASTGAPNTANTIPGGTGATGQSGTAVGGSSATAITWRPKGRNFTRQTRI